MLCEPGAGSWSRNDWPATNDYRSQNAAAGAHRPRAWKQRGVTVSWPLCKSNSQAPEPRTSEVLDTGGYGQSLSA